ncbi:MAG: radical SAM protein [Patescibacteria group bacterium]|jgi:radical SAM superfamily enzyme YgiQ (UPF0313 family)
MAKKVALISLYAGSARGIPPLGSLYLATALKKKGIGAKIFHADAGQLEELISKIRSYCPDLAGMSVFTGHLNKKYVQLSKELKKEGYQTVWGNAHPSLLPNEVLKENYVDFIIIGEGEEALAELAESLDARDQFARIKNLGYKDDSGGIHINPRREFSDIDEYLIDWSLINLEEYIIPYFSGRFQRTLAVVSSRGCPYNCQFCYNLVFNNRRWRAHSPEKIAANLEPIIKKYGIEAIRFLDDNFFVDKERAFKIVEALGLPFSADCRVEYITEDFVSRLKSAKCLELTFGFESGSDRILKEVIKKGTGTAEIIRAVTLLSGSGIIASAGIIFGAPTETKSEYLETLNFIIRLLKINPNLAFTCGWFLPYPGTGLYEKSKELGFRPPQSIEEWDKFDRWRDDYEMEWVGWDAKRAVKYSRRFVHLLALAYKRNIPILKSLLKWRAGRANFSFPLDIYIFSRLRQIYLFESGEKAHNRIIKKILNFIIKSARAAKKI